METGGRNGDKSPNQVSWGYSFYLVVCSNYTLFENEGPCNTTNNKTLLERWSYYKGIYLLYQ